MDAIEFVVIETSKNQRFSLYLQLLRSFGLDGQRRRHNRRRRRRRLLSLWSMKFWLFIPHSKVQFDSGRTCTQFLGLHYRRRSRRCLLNRQIEDISLFARL